jgi:hypothetical protein
MLMNLFGGLFHKHCPLCKQEVHEQSDEAAQRFGKWFCCEMHADLYEFDLYEALGSVHCHHTACHGEHVPLPEAAGMRSSRRPCLKTVHAAQVHERCASAHV